MKKGGSASNLWALRQIADFMATHGSPAALPVSPSSRSSSLSSSPSLSSLLALSPSLLSFSLHTFTFTYCTDLPLGFCWIWPISIHTVSPLTEENLLELSQCMFFGLFTDDCIMNLNAKLVINKSAFWAVLLGNVMSIIWHYLSFYWHVLTKLFLLSCWCCGTLFKKMASILSP